MLKALCIFGLIVAGLFAIIFGMDMATGYPFSGVGKWVMDLPMLICSLALGFVSWTTLREQI